MSTLKLLSACLNEKVTFVVTSRGLRVLVQTQTLSQNTAVKAEGLRKGDWSCVPGRKCNCFIWKNVCSMYFIVFLIKYIELFTGQPTLCVLETQIFPNKKIYFFFLKRNIKYGHDKKIQQYLVFQNTSNNL